MQAEPCLSQLSLQRAIRLTIGKRKQIYVFQCSWYILLRKLLVAFWELDIFLKLVISFHLCQVIAAKA